MVVIEFGISLISFLKPWKANTAKKNYFIGIGAFNLVKTSSYMRAGGHKAIRLCPLDDIMLGRLMKMQGCKMECLYGYRFISVRWYSSIISMTRGLMKNTYAALEFSFARLCLLSGLQIAISVWPQWALFFTSGWTWVVNAGILIFQAVLFTVAARYSDMSPKHVIWFPLTPYIRLYMTWWAVLKTISKKGIIWRDTFYSLQELKDNQL
jgi:hypothetical protein